MTVVYSEGGPELLDSLSALWESLRSHHQGITRHFPERFASMKWKVRKQGLLKKGGPDRLHVILALRNKRPVGYCIVTIDAHGEGELDSLFVDNACRGKKVGRELARRGIQWLKAFPAKDILIQVASGNERALPFYRDLGFLPYTTLLREASPVSKQ